MLDAELYHLITGNLLLTDLQRQFLLSRDVAGVSPKTYQFYKYEIMNFTLYAGDQGIKLISEVTPDLCRQFLHHMGETRNKGGVHAAWRALRAMLYWYEGEYEPDNWKNPVFKVRVPAPRPIAIPGISMEDYARLLRACVGRAGQRDKAMFYCLLDTCARADEFISLNVGDVNIVTGDVLIRAGKGDEPRYVQIASKSRKELRIYLRGREDITRAAPLFVNLKGERFSYDSLYSLLRWRSHQAGIPQPGLHDIRRAGALELLRNGADLARLSKYLGHKSIDVTMRYLAVAPDDLREMHRKNSPVDNAKI